MPGSSALGAAGAIGRMGDFPLSPIGATLPSVLSEREAEVLSWALEGSTVRETAKGLGISVETVKTYRRRAFDKLGAHTITGAVAEAIRRGVLR